MVTMVKSESGLIFVLCFCHFKWKYTIWKTLEHLKTHVLPIFHRDSLKIVKNKYCLGSNIQFSVTEHLNSDSCPVPLSSPVISHSCMKNIMNSGQSNNYCKRMSCLTFVSVSAWGRMLNVCQNDALLAH